MKLNISKSILINWLNQINREVFDNKIKSIDSIRIVMKEKDIRQRFVCCWYYPQSHRLVFFSKAHKTEFDAFVTIAHELIHIYQKECGFDYYRLNHGGKFFKYFADKICKAYEIERKGF